MKWPGYNNQGGERPAGLVAALVTVSLGMNASYVEVLCAGKGCSVLPSIQARNSL